MFGGPLDDIKDALKRISQIDDQVRAFRDEVNGQTTGLRASMDNELRLVTKRYTAASLDILKLFEEIKSIRAKLDAIKMPDRMPDIKVPANWPAWSALAINAATLAAYFVYQLAK